MLDRIVREFGRCLFLCLVFLGSNAKGQIDLGAIKAQSPQSAYSQFKAAGSNHVPLMIRVPYAETDDAANERFIPLSQGLFATYQTPEDLSALVAKHGSWRWIWSPPRHLLLDRVVTNVHADTALQTFNRTGRNVIVGIVDTGIDLRHADMRTADGHTRVVWYLDLAQPAPRGIQTELETDYGCTVPNTACAVYSSDDIDALLSSDPNDAMPVDAIGHGTHVASLAAGNGLSNTPPKYVGIAPDARLVVVNASRQNQGDLQDPDIILGVKFVFDIAQRMGMPAVVNLSLGGDAGAHDGTSTLEQELSALVGPDRPGRAIVVAAGNSADLYDTTTQYPAPLGIHTSVQVLPDGNKTRVPVVVDKSASSNIDSTFIAWVQSREGDSLSIGVDTDSGECIAPIPNIPSVPNDPPPVQKSCGGAQLTLFAGIANDQTNGGSIQRPGMALVATGKFAAPSVFALTFTGSGTAFVWVQSEAGLNPELPTMGALLPDATRERTIAIPGSATDLIAVGATLNRSDWTDITGHKQQLQRFGSLPYPVVGDVASFSAGGPNQLDAMKPDILAPGGYVVGAMASLADPRKPSQSGSMFDSTGACGDTAINTAPQCPDKTNECLCYLVDNQHGVAIGTSMASPLVAGTVALLFEVNPSLTQGDARRYLQVGAQNLPDGAEVLTLAQEGPGILDANGALTALANEPANTSRPDSFRSWMTVSTGLVHPDDQWPTLGTLHLRDSQNLPVSIDPSRISVNFSPGHLLSAIVAEGYGYYTFGFTGGAGTGRQRMHVEVLVDKQLLMKDVFDPPLYIGVDVPSARGDVVAGRGCGVANRSDRSVSCVWGTVLLLAALAIARRKSCAV
jgi:subtilisin family serine protease